MRATILEKHGPDFYKNIGKKGGKNGNNRPFRDDPDLASRAGKISAVVRRNKLVEN